MVRTVSIPAFAVAVGLATCCTFATANANQEASDSDRPFAEVYADWQAVDKELEDLVKQYRTVPADEREPLIERYKASVARQRTLLPELRSATVAAYRETPNGDKVVTSLIIGMLANDVRDDNYDAALKLGKLLLENGCEEASMFAFLGMAAYCADDFEAAKGYFDRAKGSDALSGQAQAYLEDVAEAAKLWKAELAIREEEAEADDLPRVRLTTSKGEIEIELFENEAPQAVANFVNLVDNKYYDGLTFHRVLPGFMAQGGCPTGTGTGGPGYNIFCECYEDHHRNHFRGSLSMAHAGRDTGGSQFFLTFRRTPHLDGRHTVFGRVIKGIDVLAELQRRDPSRRGQPDPDKIVKAEVLRKRDHAYEPSKVE